MTESHSSIASWDRPPRDRHIKINISRNTLIAFAISILIHAAVLFSFSTRKFVQATSVANLAPKTMSIRIAGLRPKKAQPTIPYKTIITRKQNVKLKQKSPTRLIIAKNSTTAPHPVPSNADNSAPTDLMSYINTKRQHAQELEDNAAFENAAASANARGPSADEQRDEIIKRNLQQPGTSGIFEIRHKSFRTGQFSFKGWKNNYNNARLEIIDVEAGPDDNIDLAIVKKMIEMIRREYKGDFKWESRRLGRVIVLSARKEDNAGLEDFLIQEFFTR
jgi:hypothetical protein